jgi:IS5 family transposase
VTTKLALTKLMGMTHQPSFSQAEFADKKKITRREKFLTRMEALIPWPKLLAVIEPFYPILKNIFRHRKVRYRGLAKNGHQLYTLLGLANVIIGARQATA